MLKRQSPTKAYESASYGLPLASCIVRKSASIWVGCHSFGQPVVDRHAGVRGQLLDVGLRVAAELDRVVHPAEHPRRVGDRLLVAELRSGRVEVGDVSTLVERGHLERRPGARRRLLEDQRDLLAVEPLDLAPGVLGDLQRLRQLQEEAQLAGLEVDLLDEAAIAQVEHRENSFPAWRWSPDRPWPTGGVISRMLRDALRLCGGSGYPRPTRARVDRPRFVNAR